MVRGHLHLWNIWSFKGRLWYPFHTSNTVFLVRDGIVDTSLNGMVCGASPWALPYSTLADPRFIEAYHPSLLQPPSWVPLCRDPLPNWLHDANMHIPVDICLHLLFPVMKDWDWCVYSTGLGTLLELDVNWCTHQCLQLLVWASIESTRWKRLYQPILHARDFFWHLGVW